MPFGVLGDPCVERRVNALLSAIRRQEDLIDRALCARDRKDFAAACKEREIKRGQLLDLLAQLIRKEG